MLFVMTGGFANDAFQNRVESALHRLQNRNLCCSADVQSLSIADQPPYLPVAIRALPLPGQSIGVQAPWRPIVNRLVDAERPPNRYWTRYILLPAGVTFTPNPRKSSSHKRMSFSPAAKLSIIRFVIFPVGIASSGKHLASTKRCTSYHSGASQVSFIRSKPRETDRKCQKWLIAADLA